MLESPQSHILKKNQNMKTKLSKEKEFYIAMTFLIAVIIFLFSNISTPVGRETGLNLATVYHLAVFFAFTFF